VFTFRLIDSPLLMLCAVAKPSMPPPETGGVFPSVQELVPGLLRQRRRWFGFALVG